ncbi:hypothetical protein TCAL_04779 [Tigriopus californicus]|uniref:Peroxidase n=1 Tax=Tigriopus californicus TaxID=6832 RepID=A0A553PB46_TIGCA|nr:peroxidasin-like [Tigriopus californicus]TRY74903.1 hypothetical protein TCAL_04779 [Tigriopus californicus]|eukprot:TCALIF_04779-PA protein Name:"Similar to Pxn Peroxidasin (Drosophila melanogaster)" AED:0.00 eAED:0.00 QI:56/1/1/1/1/1/2/53/701
MKKLFLILGLLVATGAAFDMDSVLDRAENELSLELNRKLPLGSKDSVFARKKSTPESKVMHAYNSLIRRSLSILKDEGVKDLDLICLIRRAISKRRHRGRAPGFMNQNLRPIALVDDICNGVNPNCSSHANSPYRTLDGTCNNLNNPYWGAISSAMRRWREPAYQNGRDTPRGSNPSRARGRKRRSRRGRRQGPRGKRGPRSRNCSQNPAGTLPNARLVSNKFHPDCDVPDKVATHMVAIMGQFLDHDITLTPEDEAQDCCTGSAEETCLPISVGPKDSFFSNHKVKCLEFTRSVEFCEESEGHREQLNAITAFVDASNVYGSSQEVSESLREKSGGLLKTSSSSSYTMLPSINGSYQAGDVRALENPALCSMHTLFLREHNRIAKALASKNPSLSDEVLYQQARRIVSAEMQNVVYGEFLTVILGQNAMNENGLTLGSGPSTYNPKVDPSIRNVFATAAFRFGHSMIEGVVNMVHESTRAVKASYKLKHNFFNTSNYLSHNGAGMEMIIGGLISQPAQSADRFIIPDLTNHLFQGNGSTFGTDLIARNIQRGREHGLASYNAYREFCGHQAACSWSKKPSDVASSTWKILKTLYNHPNDIDVFVGGLAETPQKGDLTGSTFQCLMAKQFQMLKEGDRYFFTHSEQAGSFTPDQRSNLLTRTLRDIICDNTRIPEVRSNVFDATTPFQSCTCSNSLNIKLF